MSGSGAPPPHPTRGGPPPTGSENAGLAASSYLLGGMAFYGGIGWAIGHWVWHSALFFPLGMVIGLVLAIVLIIFRFGRS
jgi:ATP synthase protein I